MSGYFRPGSKPGGLMIQPWIFRLSFDDVYQISSTWPSVRPASRPALSEVRMRGGPAGVARITATSDGTLGVLVVNAMLPSLATEKLPPPDALPAPPRLLATILCEPSSANNASLVLP